MIPKVNERLQLDMRLDMDGQLDETVDMLVVQCLPTLTGGSWPKHHIDH